MKKLFYLLAVSFVLYTCGSQQNTSKTVESAPAKTVAEYASTITADELKTDLYTYASDEFEGRETGAEGQKKAVNFLKERYESLGIPAAKKDGNYFQEVPLEVLEAPTVELSIDGQSFNPIDDFVSALGTSSGTINTDEIVYADYGIEDENYSSYKDLDVEGKVVLIKSGEPKDANRNYLVTGTTENSKWSNFRQEYAEKRDLAKKKGVKALLFYYPEVYSFVSRRFGSGSGRMSLKGNPENMYYIFVSDSLAKAINNDIETDTTPKVLKKKFAMDFTKNIKEFSSENVAAFLKGTEHPDEVIVVSAHLDHEGVKNGEVYNGADDDGSGTVAVLQIADAFKQAAKDGNGPKRSILFLHVTGEEKGLLGSQYYTDFDPIVPLANTVADLNIDMIGRIDPAHENSPNYLYLIGSDKLSTELHNLSEEVNKDCCNLVFDYTYNDENDPNRFYYRSDHYNFAKNNIPVIFYFNGTHADYHQPSDTPDKINYEFLQDRTRLIFQTAWKVANLEHRLIVDKEFH